MQSLKSSNFFFIYLLFVTTVFAQTDKVGDSYVSSDSIVTPQLAYKYIRGIEQDEHLGFNPVMTAKKIVLYVPSRFIDGIKYASGYGTDLINDPKFLDNLEPLFFNSDHSLGWYPLLDITSGLRPRGGLSLIMKKTPFQIIIRGKYADEEKFKTETRLSYFNVNNDRALSLNLSVLYEYDDDRKYYGFGASPGTDPRNQMLANAPAEYGIYFQEHTGVHLTVGIRPVNHFSYYFTSAWDQRNIKDPFEGNKRLSDTFDLDYVPGINSIYSQWYNELTLRFDNHNRDFYMSKGVFTELYAGINHGTSKKSHYSLKTGLDFYSHIPVLKNNRVITPRLALQTIKTLNANRIIPFTEYPGHQTFRGVNSRTFLRLDHIIMVPSLQYSWPISFNLGGHLFVDYLLGSKKWEKLSLSNTPWATGFILDFHSPYEELANAKFIYGSEGWRFHIDIGISIY